MLYLTLEIIYLKNKKTSFRQPYYEKSGNYKLVLSAVYTLLVHKCNAANFQKLSFCLLIFVRANFFWNCSIMNWIILKVFIISDIKYLGLWNTNICGNIVILPKIS